jgi:hypothetical protein
MAENVSVVYLNSMPLLLKYLSYSGTNVLWVAVEILLNLIVASYIGQVDWQA